MIAAWSLCTEVLDQSTRALFFERVLIARNTSHQRIFSLDFFHVAFQFVCGFRHFDAAHILFCSKLIHYDFLKSVGLTCSHIRHYEIQKARNGLLNALGLCLSPGIFLFPIVGWCYRVWSSHTTQNESRAVGEVSYRVWAVRKTEVVRRLPRVYGNCRRSPYFKIVIYSSLL